LVPTISAAIAKNEIQTAKRRIEFSILATILIGLPCSTCMSLFANPILNLLFPNASSGAEMLQISSWTIIFVVLIQTINGALQGLGKVNIPVIAFAISATIKLILNLLLLPLLGIKGAIISSIISHIIAFIICFTSLKRNLDLSFKLNKFIFKPIIACLIMTVFSYLIYIKLYEIMDQRFLLIISLMIGIIIYVISIFILKILSQEEIFMIPYGKKLYKRVKR